MSNTNKRDPVSRLDLNLFRVFSAIYKERSLTRAADRLCVSQSAVSHSLTKMRDQLGDPLFIREPKGVTPTAFSKLIWPDVQNGLAIFDRTANRTASFDPNNDVKQITIAINEVAEPSILPILVKAIQKEAPKVWVDSVKINRASMRADLATEKLDCVIDVAHPADPQLMHSQITSDEFVVVSRAKSLIDYEGYLTAEHVTVSSRRTGKSVEDWELSRQGINRTITTRCQNYNSALQLVANSDLLLTMPRSLAVSNNKLLNNFIHDLPVEIPPVDLHMFWHEEREDSASNIWLRNILLELYS